MTALLAPPPKKPPVRHRFTIAQYRALGRSGLFQNAKTILLAGELFTVPMPDPPHDTALGLTDAWVRSAFAVGHHVRSQMGFDIGTENDPGPDLAVVVGGIRDYAATTPAAAVLIVEVADSSLFLDTTTKTELYATAGVPDYWVIDLENRRLLVYRDPVPLPSGLGATAYQTHRALGPNDAVSPLALPSASVRVGDLLP